MGKRMKLRSIVAPLDGVMTAVEKYLYSPITVSLNEALTIECFSNHVTNQND